MSDQHNLYPNGIDPSQPWQAQLVATARALPYPATPDLAPAVLRQALAGLPGRSRPASAAAPRAPLGWVWAGVLALALLGGLLAVPLVRAGVLEFLQIGVVRIQLAATPTLTPAPTATGTRPASTPTLPPTPTALSSVLDVAGQTTWPDAQARAPFEINLPTYPPGLGEPDLAFVQDLEGSAVILVWLQPDDPTQIKLTLHYLTNSDLANKLVYGVLKQTPGAVEFTRVNDREAVWTTGPYILVTRNGSYAERRLIEGHVLIWTSGDLTYRLETSLSRAEAVKIAESIEP